MHLVAHQAFTEDTNVNSLRGGDANSANCDATNSWFALEI